MKKFNLVKGLVISLMAFALAFTAFGAVSASAEEVAAPTAATGVTYQAGANTITSTPGYVVYVLKNESGNTIKANAVPAGKIPSTGILSLDKLNIKSTTKDAYLYVCSTAFKAEGTDIAPNMIIKAQAAKKVVGKIDYTKADKTDATDVLSIVATDKEKAVIENAACVWSENGKDYSESTAFTGAKLASMLGNGGQIFVKMNGVDGESGNAQFASKAIKVKIAKQGKAPKVKYDPKKDTIALKNGFDFALATKDGNGKYTIDNNTWKTILPVLGTATPETAAASIVETTAYKPVDKKDEAAATNYTQYKFKTMSMAYLLGKLGNPSTDTVYIAVRQSATVKKPASAVTYIAFDKQTAAPIVYTASNVAGQYDVAKASDFTKGFVIGKVANYNGENGTEGYDDSFVLKNNNAGADKATAAYEFCAVMKSDYTSFSNNKIDWTSLTWKKLDPAKTKINSKLKIKYNDIDGNAVTGTLTAGSLAEAASSAVPAGVDTILLVRRAGVKNGNVRPSEPIVLYVVEGEDDYTLYSTVANGESADKYKVDFYTLQKNQSGVYTWTKDTEIASVTGWGKNGETENVKFPTIAGAKFYEYDGSVVGNEKTATNSKYAITVAATIRVAIVKTFKVTVDFNGGKLTEGAKSTAVYETDKNGKITLPESSAMTPPEGKAFDKFATAKSEGTNVTGDTVFGEDTTVYALWKDATP